MRAASLPKYWLMTDERLGGKSREDPLWQAIGRLPPESGIVFRHYSWNLADRRKLFHEIQAVSRTRDLLLVMSRFPYVAGPRHLPAKDTSVGDGRILTAAAHNLREAKRAVGLGAKLLFVSPVYPTASHPGEPHLGPARFRAIARAVPVPVVALGGMTAARARLLPEAHGFAAISWWAR